MPDDDDDDDGDGDDDCDDDDDGDGDGDCDGDGDDDCDNDDDDLGSLVPRAGGGNLLNRMLPCVHGRGPGNIRQGRIIWLPCDAAHDTEEGHCPHHG